MLGNKNRMLLQSIKTFVARDARQKLQKLVEKAHPADLGLLFGHLRMSEVRRVVDLLPGRDRRARVLSETKPELAAEVLQELPPREISLLLQEMYSDDAATILEAFEAGLKTAVLQEMAEDQSQEVEQRLEYAEKTAGRIMVPDFLALPADTTVAEAIAALQTANDLELVYYLYVVGETGQLVGVVSLRQLLLVGPKTRLKDIMVRDVITARPQEDQEDVARRVARYNLVALPVVDDLGRMQGIITVDDVIDVIKEEATEDLLRMAGTSGEDSWNNGGVLQSLRQRWPWMLVSCCSGLFALAVIHRFEGAIAQMMLLAGFIPMVLGMGGNTGAQSSTLVSRGLLGGMMDARQMLEVILRELRVGVLLGLSYGVVLAAGVLLLARLSVISLAGHSAMTVATVAGLGVLSSMAVAAMVGAVIPLLLDRMRIDPAIATGPLVTSAVDGLGLLVYLWIATALLDL